MEKYYLPAEELIEACGGSLYTLTVLVAKRAMQLADGDKPLVEKPADKVIDTALQEVVEKKIRVQGKKKKQDK
ncbi:MAG: DNA-directed RNA polymerase subunit omega [Candidatus Omnitrophota bacterium]